MGMTQNLNELMKQAQQMQESMQKAQQSLAELIVYGRAGGTMVEIKMNGKHEVLEVNLHTSMLDDKEMLSDLLVAAFNNAVSKVEKASKEKIAELTAGLNIPTDFMQMKDDEKEG